MPYFVFLEFTDRRVRGFLTSLRTKLSGYSSDSPVHITVRGPYGEMPEASTLRHLTENLQGYGVVIGGAGTFETKKGFAVYLKVQSPIFQQIWWKPDFKVQEFGRNPHVTLYETASAVNAQKVERFLRKEKIEIMTFRFALTVHKSKQLSLFEPTVEVPVKKGISFGKWNVKPGIEDRASALCKQLDPQQDNGEA